MMGGAEKSIIGGAESMGNKHRFIFHAAAVLILLAATGSDVSCEAGAAGRINAYNTGAELLDSGENERAAAYFLQRIDDHPPRIEIAEGLVDAYARRCMLDSVFNILVAASNSLSDSEREAYDRYLESVRHRQAREFNAAAEAALQAAEIYFNRKDTLAVVVCMRTAAQSYVSARNGRQAVRAVEEAEVYLIEFDERIALSLKAIRAEAFNVMDDLVAADGLHREVLDRAVENNFRQIGAYCLSGLGRIANKRDRLREAVDFYSRALMEEKALGARERIAALLNNLGQVESTLRSYDKAKAYLEESRETALSCGAGWILGYIYYGLGSIAQQKDNRDEALSYFQKSYESHHNEGNLWGELGARLRVAVNLGVLGEYSEAVEHYEFCRRRYDEMGSLYGLSWTLSGLAAAYHNLGDFSAAENNYQQAYEVYEKLGNRKQAAWSLNALGMVYDNQDRYREALIHEHRAMAIYEELGDLDGIGTVHFSMGSVYFYLGNYSKSIEHYERALSIASETGNIEIKRRVLSGLSAVYAAAGKLDLAGGYYHEYLGEARASGDHAGIIWALNNLASFYIETGEMITAHELLDEALSLISEGGQDYLRARTLYLFGMSDPSATEAIKRLEQALFLADKNGMSELRWKCLTELGERHWMKGDIERGRHYFDEAILEIESIRHRVGARELQMHMLRAAIKPYERIIQLIVMSTSADAAAAEAFVYSERARAQGFSSLLREARFRGGGTRTDAPVAKERRLMARLTVIQRKLQDASLPDDERMKILSRMERIERELESIRLQTAAGSGAYDASIYNSVETLATLTSALKPSELVLSFSLGRKSSYLFVLRGTEVSVHAMPPRSEIEKKVGYFLSIVRQPATDGGSWMSRGRETIPKEIVDTASRELSTYLLGSAKRELHPGDVLVIVPDGFLHRLPFSLLVDESGYLGDQHEIFYIPSLSSLYYLRERDRIRSREGRVAVLDMVSVGSRGAERRGFYSAPRVYPMTDIPVEPLVNAAKEARTVAGLFGETVVLVGADAREEGFKKSPIGDAAILHIASHSYADDEDIRRSFIVLNQEESLADSVAGSGQDGLLQWHEIAALELNASLVSLSACRSAGGVLAYGEGITGLTQAFLYAGGSCILASQVDIPDRYASRFMVAFYRYFKRGLPASAALQATQRDASEWKGAASNPALWGGFILIGDGRVSVRPR